jgi:hypothetical protein
MSHQAKSAARMSQNFHHTLFISDYNVTPSKICGTHVTEFSIYSLFGDGEGRGYTVCTSVNICQYIAYLGMEKGGVTLSVRQSTSVSQTNGILWHKWLSQNFHHTLYISDYNVSPMEICGTIVAEFSLFYYISD